MSKTITQLITGRIVSGNPFGRSTITNRYQITIAVDRDGIGMDSFFRKVGHIIKQHWPNENSPEVLNEDFDWNLIEYKDCREDGKPYVDYCLGRLLIYIDEEQAPLVVMPDGAEGWEPIRHSGIINTGDYVKVELELSPNPGKFKPCVNLKPKFIALFEVGKKVDLEQDTARIRYKILLEEVSKTLGKSLNLVR